jgi:hypothetical protein
MHPRIGKNPNGHDFHIYKVAKDILKNLRPRGTPQGVIVPTDKEASDEELIRIGQKIMKVITLQRPRFNLIKLTPCRDEDDALIKLLIIYN